MNPEFQESVQKILGLHFRTPKSIPIQNLDFQKLIPEKNWKTPVLLEITGPTNSGRTWLGLNAGLDMLEEDKILIWIRPEGAPPTQVTLEEKDLKRILKIDLPETSKLVLTRKFILETTEKTGCIFIDDADRQEQPDSSTPMHEIAETAQRTHSCSLIWSILGEPPDFRSFPGLSTGLAAIRIGITPPLESNEFLKNTKTQITLLRHPSGIWGTTQEIEIPKY